MTHLWLNIALILALCVSWMSPPRGVSASQIVTKEDRATDALLGALLALGRGRGEEETMGALFAAADQLVQEGKARAALRV